MSATGQKIWEFIKKQGAFFGYLFWHDPWLEKFSRFWRRLSLRRRAWLVGGITGGLALFFVLLPLAADAAMGAKILSWFLTPIAGWTAKLLAMVGGAFNGVINGPMFSTIITAPAVDIGWTATRDVCNIVFILILLGIGFATILRVPTYHIKKLIVPFIVALLLINFSKLICGVVTDFCHVLMASFAAAMTGGNNYSGSIAGSLGLDNWINPNSYTEGSQVADYDRVQLLLTIIIFMIALIFAFLLLVILLISRWITLMVLTIFSPLVYAAQILPATKGFAKKWWQQFLQTAFYGPAAVFMVYLAVQIVATSVSDATLKADQSEFSASVNVPANVITWETLVALGIACIILYKAVTFSKNLGIAGAGAVVGTAEKWGKKGLGAVGGGLAGGLGAVTGFSALRSRLGTAMKTRKEARDAARKETGERWGAALGRRTLLSSAAREKARQKQQGLWAAREKQVAEGMQTGDMNNQGLNDKLKNGSREEKLAAGTELAKRGELDSTEYKKLKNMGGVSATGLAGLKDAMVKHNPYATLEGSDAEKRTKMDQIMQKANLKDLSPNALTGAGSDMLIKSMAAVRGKDAVIDAEKNLNTEADKGKLKANVKGIADAGGSGKEYDNIAQANLAINKQLPSGATPAQLAMLAEKGDAKDLGRTMNTASLAPGSQGAQAFYQAISPSKLGHMAENMNSAVVGSQVQQWQQSNSGNLAAIDAARRNLVVGSYLTPPPAPPAPPRIIIP